jgi:hypothetical protein
MNKSEYILRSLAKISRKKWEYFIISRIIHRLDDYSIEFVAQQLVKRLDGSRALTDLFFPQFGLHLEIDEPFHAGNVVHDVMRERDIVSVTGHDIKRIRVLNDQGSEKSLQTICAEVDGFIDLVRKSKTEKEAKASFVPWDLTLRYSAQPVIERGYLDVKDNVTFKVQVEAMKCFGFKGKGYQRGAWNINDGTGDWIWFPRLYEHYIWINEMTADGQHIYQRANSDEARNQNISSLEGSQNTQEPNVIVFAKARDSLGANLLRYVGTFRRDIVQSCADFIKFDLVRTHEPVRIGSTRM